MSLISGADLALLYDTELALNKVDGSPRAVANLYSMHSASEAIAAVACSLLLLVSMHVVIVIQVIAGCLPMLIAITLVEPGHRAGKEHEPLRFAEVLRHLLANGSIMRWTVLSLSLWSLTTFFAVWIVQRYWFENQVPLAMFGYLWAFYTAVAGLAGRWAARTESWLGVPGLLVLVGLLPVLGYVGLATLPLLWALAVSLAFFVARGLGLVVLRDALNRRTPSHFRATANSMASFGFRAAFVVAGPLVGAFMDKTDMTSTLWLLAVGSMVVSASVLLPLWRAIARAELGPVESVPATVNPKGRNG